MSQITVYGGHPLLGTVPIQGAKNSALPILAASLLCDGKTVIENCPRLSDVDAATDILRTLGCSVKRMGTTVAVESEKAKSVPICKEQTCKLRASVNFMGALLGRFGTVTIGHPGGCVLGKRPIDYHLAAFAQMGAEICECEEEYILRWRKRRGCEIRLPFPSVGATENILVAAVTVSEPVRMIGAACEPEIGDLCRYLTACGARIEGIGTSTLTVYGGKPLRGCRHRLIPDRMETATYLTAVAACGGKVKLTHTDPTLVLPILSVLEDAGCEISDGKDTLVCAKNRRLKGFGNVITGGYPLFPTDAQATMTAAALTAEGRSLFCDRVFPERFVHLAQYRRFGGQITLCGATACVDGVNRLHGASATATDLRGGAGVLIAALSADGESKLEQMELLDRGYALWRKRFAALGADIRTKEE